MGEAAIKNLRENQQQVDMDGVMVGVSRQALDEVLTYTAELEAERIHFEAVAMTAIEENEKLEAEVENLYKASQFWIVACGERYDWFQESLRENAKLRESLAEIREIYTGSEGIPQPETAAEAYVLRLVEQMYNAAVDALQGFG